MLQVVFTAHARTKLEVLNRHGFNLTLEQVEKIVLSPSKLVSHIGEQFIAQSRINERHVLRVVYREEGENRVVITFYPGRRDRYEN